MKKKLIAALIVSTLSLGVGTVAVASQSVPWWRLIEIAYEIWQENQSGSAQCATTVEDGDDYRVLKCEGDGCRWVPGRAVSWGGKC